MQGSPFSVTLNITLKNADGDTISWSDADEFIPLVEGLPSWSPDHVIGLDSLEPTVANPTDGVITLSWSAAQTQALSTVGSARWAFLMTFEEEGGPYPLVGGSLEMSDPTQPGSSTGTAANLTVNLGNITATLNVTIGGGGGGGGAALMDIGNIAVVFTNVTGDSFDEPYVLIAPPHGGSEPPGTVRSSPEQATDFTPLQALAAGQEVGVVAFEDLTPDLWDQVDVFAEVVIWDQAGENVLVAQGGASGITSDSEPTPVKLSLIQVIGSDLSIVDPGVIQTASGGSYNLLIKSGASWD